LADSYKQEYKNTSETNQMEDLKNQNIRTLMKEKQIFQWDKASIICKEENTKIPPSFIVQIK
jgi:hypothetical protein